jgi:hypothetical protein
MVNGPAGWPEYEYGGVCRQSVGVRSFWDALNIERRYCAKPGHKADVDSQALSAELAERVRHDLEGQPGFYPVTAADWQGVRPEIAGRLR